MAVDYSQGTYYGGPNLPVISKEGQAAQGSWNVGRAPNPVLPSQGGGSSGFSAPSGSFTATGAALGTVIPGVGTAVGAAVGGVIDLGLNIYGAVKQAKKEKEDAAAAKRWAEIQNELSMKESARQWRWLEEERDYKYANDFQQGLWNMMNADATFKNNLAQLYRRAA